MRSENEGFRTRTGESIALDLVPTPQILGDDDTDTRLLHAMARDAEAYISSFQWCGAVCESYFGGGVGGIFAIFLFRIRPNRADVDEWIWIMGGDTPLAYLPIGDCSSVGEAFRLYMWGMRNWIDLARHGKTEQVCEVPPVNLPLTAESADWLERRLQILTLLIQPFLDDESAPSVQ